MTDRLSCCVPFCKRTRKADGSTEWLCGNHWPLVPAKLRRLKSLAERRYKRRYANRSFWTFPAGSPDRLGAVRLDRLCNRLWERCKKAAIERAAGI